MSYATSLLMAYPPPYGPSTLLSDDLVQRSALGAYYEPPLPYTGGSRLFSNNLAYNDIGLGPSSYRSSTNYQTPSITNWQIDIPQPISYAPINNISEYSESLGTRSNRNTASSIARSIEENKFSGTTNIFPDYQPSYNRLSTNVDRNSHLTTIWSPTRPKIPINDEKPTSTYRSLPELSSTIVQKQTLMEELKKDTAPVPAPSLPPPPPPPILTKQEGNLPKEPTSVDNEKQRPSVDVREWLTEGRDESMQDEKVAEQAWTNKIDQLHTMQAQREKEKAKALRALPNLTKKVDHKPSTESYDRRNESYFDSLFDGNYYRKTSINQQSLNSSYQQSLSSRNKSTTNSYSKPKTNVFPKYFSPRKAPQYEPPTANRVLPNTTTTPGKKQGPKQNQHDALTPRENIHKDSDERFREALQKVRSDRAEQQLKESNESTAKRLHYGNYVRNSSKGDLLQNIIKPLPWSVFLESKKGNAYSLTKEEKKDLYNESKTYGERVRNRNYILHNGGDETSLTERRPGPFKAHQFDDDDDEAINENDSKPSKRSGSNSTMRTTNKTFTKQSIHSGRTSKLTNQTSSAIRPSEEDNEDLSDYESNRKQKKRLYDSSVRTTSATEDSENDETSDQQSTRMKNHETDEDLFTVREEKTLESLEGARYKKR